MRALALKILNLEAAALAKKIQKNFDRLI